MLDPAAVIGALTRLAEKGPIAGVAYGTGLEDHPDLIDAIAGRWPLLGNPGAVVACLKDPAAFAEFCRAEKIPHPDIAFDPPPEPAAWLAKRRGGSGGSHIVPGDQATPGMYFQRRITGRAVSALFLADGARACIVGFSEQWTAPTPETPFRYGGAVQPADLDVATRASVESAIARITLATGLVGLNSADFLIDGERAWCLEVNPRAGASLDIFDGDAAPLFLLHVRACRGELPAAMPCGPGARAANIVYAGHDIPALPLIDWPMWAADRQPAGSSVAAGQPVCTVMADATTKEEALERVHARAAAITVAASGRAA